jgi:hypothetical protein
MNHKPAAAGLRRRRLALERSRGHRAASDSDAGSQAIVEARLAVSMSTKPDFSDVVSADGSFAHKATRHVV